VEITRLIIFQVLVLKCKSIVSVIVKIFYQDDEGFVYHNSVFYGYDQKGRNIMEMEKKIKICYD